MFKATATYTETDDASDKYEKSTKYQKKNQENKILGQTNNKSNPVIMVCSPTI